MVASAESTTDIGEMSVDARRLEGGAGFAQKERDRLRGLVGRLRADHESEFLAARLVPGEAAFRLEKHRVDRLGLEFAVQYQNGRIARREFRANLLAVGRRFQIGGSAGPPSGVHTGRSVLWKCPGLTQPSLTGE
jgi:hypothetical protein